MLMSGAFRETLWDMTQVRSAAERGYIFWIKDQEMDVRVLIFRSSEQDHNYKDLKYKFCHLSTPRCGYCFVLGVILF